MNPEDRSEMVNTLAGLRPTSELYGLLKKHVLKKYRKEREKVLRARYEEVRS